MDGIFFNSTRSFDGYVSGREYANCIRCGPFV